MSFARPNTATAPEAANTLPSQPGRAQVITELRDLFERGRIDPSFAVAFVEQVCQPCTRWEHPRLVATIGGGNRWEYAYRNRVTKCAAVFLAMPEAERAMIVSGATNDGVRWRGEPVDVYLDIHRETLEMRALGVAEYVKRNRLSQHVGRG